MWLFRKFGWGVVAVAVIILLNLVWVLWGVIQSFELLDDERDATGYFEGVTSAFEGLEDSWAKCEDSGSSVCETDAYEVLFTALPESPPPVLAHMNAAHEDLLQSLAELIEFLSQLSNEPIDQLARNEPERFERILDAWEAWKTAALGPRLPTPEPGNT